MKRVNFTTGILLLYLAVIGFISWPGRRQDISYGEFFSVMGVTIALILLLRVVQVRRLKLREKRRKEEEREDR